jgi:FMN phosphatase YigB (HAD superfamily)
MFIDDRKENVVAARSCGMHGVVYDIRRTPVAILEKSLRNAVLNPLARGSEFLRIRAGHLITQTEDGTELSENFAQLLILEVTDDKLIAAFHRILA